MPRVWQIFMGVCVVSKCLYLYLYLESLTVWVNCPGEQWFISAGNARCLEWRQQSKKKAKRENARMATASAPNKFLVKGTELLRKGTLLHRVSQTLAWWSCSFPSIQNEAATTTILTSKANFSMHAVCTKRRWLAWQRQRQNANKTVLLTA